MIRKTLAVALGLIFWLPTSAPAQYPFGHNKVVYSRKDWKVLQTPHLDIYHYPSERNLVAHVAPDLEKTYLEYSVFFDLEFEDRLPVVLFSSHYDFQQTNIIPSLISDYTGGFTDIIRGRIAAPFTGSYSYFLHVLRHEMVHAFMLEKISRVMSANHKYNSAPPPLWFTEGMAEFVANPNADTQSNMYIRDALMHSQLLDLMNVWRIEGSFMMYKQGEAVLRFIATNFGPKAIARILENWWVSDNFSIVLERTINMDLQELSDAFLRSIKRRHYPAILDARFTTDIARQLTPPLSFHNRPVYGPDEKGRTVVYTLYADDGVVNIGSLELREDKKTKDKNLIRGGRSAAIESIPAFRSKIETAGDTLIFVAKSYDRDRIFLWNLTERKQIQSVSFDGLGMISSPTISPRRDRLVFSAIDTTGMLDLYLYQLPDGPLDRLTRDYHIEDDADFHPHRDLVLFSSDRNCQNRSNNRSLCSFDLSSRRITRLTSGDHADTYPEWAPDGKSFLFTSDRDGKFDVYLYRDHEVIRQTNVLGGVSAASFAPSGDRFVAGGYYDAEFQIFEFDLEGGRPKAEPSIVTVDSIPTDWISTTEFPYLARKYAPKFGLDFVGAGIALDPDFGELGNGGQLAFTDLLGNQQIYVFFGNTSEGFDDFWRRLNVGFNYINLSHRLHYSIGVFHLNTYFGDFFSLFRSERRYGAALGLSYPLSRFTRLDGSIVARRVERENDFDGFEFGSIHSILASSYLTFATDHTLWTIGGPLTGYRYYVTVGNTQDFQNKGLENSSLMVDVRKYLKIHRRVLLAGRFINRNSWGGDLQLYYLGGPWDFRGWDFRRFVGRTVYLFNTELRFPLIDRLNLGLPFGAIEFPMIRGALFFDAGKTSRYVLDTDWLGSMGIGAELNLGYAPVIRVNFTRTTDFSSIDSDTQVEFFIGLNY